MTTFAALWAVAAVVLLQDGLRSALLSRELPAWALAGDTLSFCALSIPLVLGLLPRAALGVLESWAAAVALGVVVSLVGLARARKGNYVRQSIVAAWKLGRWATLDATFAVVAYLLPMFVATIYVQSTAAGTYRVLQTALGPLNIIQTTVVTVFGLDAWQTTSIEGLRSLQRKVKVLAVALLVLAAGCSAAGLPLMVLITHLRDADLWRIGLIVAAHGTMTAVTTPFLAAAFALGYQKFGAVIRCVSLVVCVVVSLPIAGAQWVPWNDQIGTAMLASSGLTLIGWLISYSSATRREEHALAGEVPSLRPKRGTYLGRHRMDGPL